MILLTEDPTNKRSFNLMHCTAFFLLVALAVVSVSGPAAAEQGFALIGTWQRSDPQVTVAFTLNPNGTFDAQYCTAGQYGSGCMQWNGVYRPTGALSYVYKVQSFQGAGGSCPPQRGDMPGSNGCGYAQMLGIKVGVQRDESFQM